MINPADSCQNYGCRILDRILLEEFPPLRASPTDVTNCLFSSFDVSLEQEAVVGCIRGSAAA